MVAAHIRFGHAAAGSDLEIANSKQNQTSCGVLHITVTPSDLVWRPGAWTSLIDVWSVMRWVRRRRWPSLLQVWIACRTVGKTRNRNGLSPNPTYCHHFCKGSNLIHCKTEPKTSTGDDVRDVDQWMWWAERNILETDVVLVKLAIESRNWLMSRIWYLINLIMDPLPECIWLIVAADCAVYE